MKKTILKWIFGVIAALLVLLVAGGWRSEAGSSLTAVHFYEKLGYPFKNGVTAHTDLEGNKCWRNV